MGQMTLTLVLLIPSGLLIAKCLSRAGWNKAALALLGATVMLGIAALLWGEMMVMSSHIRMRCSICGKQYQIERKLFCYHAADQIFFLLQLRHIWNNHRDCVSCMKSLSCNLSGKSRCM